MEENINFYLYRNYLFNDEAYYVDYNKYYNPDLPYIEKKELEAYSTILSKNALYYVKIKFIKDKNDGLIPVNLNIDIKMFENMGKYKNAFKAIGNIKKDYLYIENYEIDMLDDYVKKNIENKKNNYDIVKIYFDNELKYEKEIDNDTVLSFELNDNYLQKNVIKKITIEFKNRCKMFENDYYYKYRCFDKFVYNLNNIIKVNDKDFIYYRIKEITKYYINTEVFYNNKFLENYKCGVDEESGATFNLYALLYDYAFWMDEILENKKNEEKSFDETKNDSGFDDEFEQITNKEINYKNEMGHEIESKDLIEDEDTIEDEYVIEDEDIIGKENEDKDDIVVVPISESDFDVQLIKLYNVNTKKFKVVSVKDLHKNDSDWIKASLFFSSFC